MYERVALRTPTFLLTACLAITAIIFDLDPFDLLKKAPAKDLHGPDCETPQYTVRTLSFDPLIQHIENFLTLSEMEYLSAFAQDKLQSSKGVVSNGSKVLSPHRKSSTAFLPSTDSVARCVLARAAEYQGFADQDMMEDLQVTQYTLGQHYAPHFDWHRDPKAMNRTTNRETTFFAILDASCTSCGTRFPRLTYDWSQEDQRWCRIVDCQDHEGLTVLPIPGSATFWVNLLSDNSGDERTLHAGLPVHHGLKTGLNIWTRREIN